MMLCALVSLASLGIVVYHVITWLLSCIRVGDYVTKHVFITGCDSGFGNLLTKRLEKLGFKVFAACLTSAGAEKLQDTCSERVTTLLLDVRDEKSIAAARQFVESRLPTGRGLWALVNNAGISGVPGVTEWLTKDDWSEVLSINLMGVVQVTQAFLPLVRMAKGRVVNVASMLGRIAAGTGPYCVSKYGVEAFSDCLRREVYNQGIKVCILEPGYFKTEMINTTNLINNFRRRYDLVPEAVRLQYPQLNEHTYPKLLKMACDNSSDNIDLVIDAFVVALTSRFPPTRQLVGYDARFVFRLLWNLPTSFTDWFIFQRKRKALEGLSKA